MSVTWLAAAASLATLLGGWLVLRVLQGRRSVMRLVSGLAAGYLLAVTLARVIPECFEQGGEGAALWILAGYLLVHLVEHGITPHFHYGEETHQVEGRWTGGLALLGLSLHSLMDGMSLSAAMSTHSNLGVPMFLGILLHRIPEGATITSIFLVRGHGRRGALGAAGVLAGAAMLGALGQGWLAVPAAPTLGLAAGLGLYVASSDLLPEVQKEAGWKSSLSLMAGAGLLLLTLWLLPHRHGG
ncbi:MAG: ZIP family metal transporter [Acidobacteria bacterium]|nr:ZIP family metal transporter [Acidobacteriota bacterium]